MAIAAATGILALIALVLGTDTFLRSGPATANRMAQFDGDGWSADYPAGWQLLPSRVFARYTGVNAFLTSQPVNEARVCTLEEAGKSCDLTGLDPAPGNVIVGIGWGAWMITDPLSWWLRPSDGRAVKVGTTPAIEMEATEGDRTALSWQIMRLDSWSDWIEISAKVREPFGAARLADLRAVIASFRWDNQPAPLNVAAGPRVADKALKEIRAQDPDAYSCFPEPGGQQTETVSQLPGFGAQLHPIEVTCTTTIVPTEIGFWRLDLVASWPRTEEHAAGRTSASQWITAAGERAAWTGGGGDLPPDCCRQQ
jgi:hypothetical protein